MSQFDKTLNSQLRKLPVMRSAILVATLFGVSALAHAHSSPERASAMAKLAFMNGVWAGPAEGQNRDGSRYTVTQTERMGPMLDGDIIVIEGRGYKPDGSVGFNAFGVVSWDAMTKKYELRSYAQGYSGTFELTPTADGYVWEIPAGPGAVLRYTATVKDGKWREVGELVASGKPTQKTFEMNLVRVGETDWPLGKPVPPTVGSDRRK
jgi:hypothetical protein